MSACPEIAQLQIIYSGNGEGTIGVPLRGHLLDYTSHGASATWNLYQCNDSSLSTPQGQIDGISLSGLVGEDRSLAGNPTRVGFVCLLMSAFQGGGSGFATTSVTLQIHPAITQLSPSQQPANTSFTLSVMGNGFVAGSTVLWGTIRKTPISVTATQLDVNITASEAASQGVVQVSVDNGADFGRIANVVSGGMETGAQSLPFTITAAVPQALSITTTSPLPVATQGAAYNETLQATGGTTTYAWTEVIPAGGASGLPPGLTLMQAPGSNDTVLSGTPTQAGAYSFTVQVTDSASPAAIDSRQFTVQVNNPTPAVTQIVPDHATEGDAGFSLAVDGTGFVATSEVLWDGNARPTTFVSATRLTANILASDLAARGTAQVEVRNPAPGGGTSNALTFTIDPPVVPTPGITSITPNSAVANSSGFPLQVNGVNFDSTSVVMWGGTALATDTSGAPTQLMATVLDADLAVANPPVTVQITVVNSPPGGGMLTSNAVNFTITAPAGPAPAGVVERVSLSTGGVEGDSNSGPSATEGRATATSSDGRFVLFVSDATNLAPGANNGLRNLFLRDTCQGNAPPGCTRTTTRITTLPQAESGILFADMTPDAQWVTFTTDIPQAGVWVFSPAVPGGAAVRLNTTGLNDFYFNTAISDDGRFVAVETTAALIATDTNFFFDIYLFDRDNDGDGIYDEPGDSTVQLISDSLATPGNGGNSFSQVPDLSADGRHVVFQSAASDLIPGGTMGEQIYLRDTCFQAQGPCTPMTLLISVADAGGLGSAGSRHPRITPNGRYVVFDSGASDLLPAGMDTNNQIDVFLRDTCIGAPAGCMPSTMRVSRSATGGQLFGGESQWPTITADGRLVAFETRNSNLIASGPTGVFFHVYVADTCIGATGCTPSNRLASQRQDGTFGIIAHRLAVITADGVYVIFWSNSDNLAASDLNMVSDVFLAATGFR
jgi:Tol biopolymer transport system component